MDQKQKKVLIAAGAILAIGLVAVAVVRQTPALAEALGLAKPEPEEIAVSGFIEAEEIEIAPEVGGRIVEVRVVEGEPVEAGQVLIRLDDTLAQAQLAVAQAGLETAQAQLDRVRAGAREEQIRRAEAQLAQAEAVRDGAYQAWQDALALLENPQEIDAQIVVAEAQLAQAEAALRQAAALRDAAQIAKDAFEQAIESFPPGERRRIRVARGTIEGVLPDLQYWKASIGYNSAQAAYEGAKRILNLLYAMRNDPQQIQAQVDATEAEYRAAEAAVEMARARLEGLRAGASQEEIAAMEAQVQQAQAQVESAQVLLEKLTLTAPVSGRVVEVIGHKGELATPGIPLITLADLDQVILTVYVPESRLGQVRVGQRVEVRVDSFPDRVFIGRVVTIATEAEFIPRNIQTREERVNMVFAVKVVIPNPDHALKPGMPADAVILAREQ